MTRQYAQKLQDLKQGVFEAFQAMIPKLEEAFPEHRVVVRPHPTENPTIYHRIADRCSHVKVTNEGNVVPWLMACQAVIHNGCTTGVEAFVLGVPALSYRAVIKEEIDYGFYRLPNLVSHQCFSIDELLDRLKEILSGNMGPADGEAREKLVNQHLAATSGSLACERIVDVLEKMVNEDSDKPMPDPLSRLHGRFWAAGRTLVKHIKSRLPGSHNKPEFQRHRYPEISLEEMQNRAARFQEIIGFEKKVTVQRFHKQFFTIGP
jgi:hypothetical protein